MTTDGRYAPPQLAQINAGCAALDFQLSCTDETGALLRCLAAAKPGGSVLELGTGAGASTAWLLSGISNRGTLLTVENDPCLAALARSALHGDACLEIVEADAGELLDRIRGKEFDLIFADTWIGKFHRLGETLSLLAVGGLYVIDDLRPQPTWPPGHEAEVNRLLAELTTLDWLATSRLDCSKGILVGTRLAAGNGSAR